MMRNLSGYDRYDMIQLDGVTIRNVSIIGERDYVADVEADYIRPEDSIRVYFKPKSGISHRPPFENDVVSIAGYVDSTTRSSFHYSWDKAAEYRCNLTVVAVAYTSSLELLEAL